MNFLIGHLYSFCRWLLMYGSSVEIEHPEQAKDIIRELIEELQAHHAAPVGEA
jgi:hypothetical protein